MTAADTAPLPVTIRRPADAVSFVERYHASVMEEIDLLDRVSPGLGRRLIDATETGSTIHDVLDDAGITDETYRASAVTTSLAAMERRWWMEHGRQIVRMDPDTLDALLDTPGDTVLPDDPFAYLPFGVFIIVFNRPIQLPNGRVLQALTVTMGNIIRNVGPGAISLSSHAYQSQSAASSVDVDDIASTWRIIDRTDGSTVDSIAASVVSRIMNATERAVRSEEIVLRVAIATLLYLSTPSADIVEDEPTPKQRKIARKQRKTLPRTHRAGFRVGTALRQHRRGASRSSWEPTGRTVAPHIRRAHWHTVRFGPGRSERRLDWFPPTPVNVGTDGVTIPTVRRA